MSLRRWGGLTALALLAAIPPLTAPPAQAGGFRLFGREEPKPPVILLAERIDEIEESLNETGTIVAKKPDVWGESRLTRHREEVEEELAKRIDKFELLLNASVSRSDAAFFANALTLQAALGAGATPPTVPTPLSPTAASSLIIQNPAGGAENSDVLVRTTPGAMRIATRTGDDAGELGFASTGIGLEPTIQLDQLKRYLDHLNELRRLNEGGDTADAPGYALNLVRIPVSVLPGGETRIGHGAEITVTAETHLTPELLPTAFRTLVVQDLIDQLALPVLKIAEAQAWKAKENSAEVQRLRQLQHRLECLLTRVSRFITAFQLAGAKTDGLSAEAKCILKEWEIIKSELAAVGIIVPPDQADAFEKALQSFIDADQSSFAPARMEKFRVQLQTATEVLRSLSSGVENLVQPLQVSLQALEQAVSAVATTVPSSSSSARVARYAVPPSRLVEVFGDQELFTIAKAFDRVREQECAGVVHLSDARAFLAEELQAAYDFLLSPNGVCHWTCAPELALSLRGGEVPFEQRLAVTEGGQTVVRSLAWAVLVEAALLNERLNEDMRRVSGDPDCNCMYGGPYVFLGPDPPMDARYAFMEYVRCRWPIQVFALDPVNQDQNIADEFSLRRELQLSAAVALASGSISASDAMRFTRQIALDQETIALNTTAAAFAHGANTFGWRFYPRFQTAEIESNTTVLFRDLLVGGPQRDHLIRDYRIEPGMRECVALVVMPSFVPHVRFDIRSNWFELTDPEDTEASMTETVELSRKIGEMQQLMEVCAVEAHCYRPGELQRLQARVKQLSDKLPLQTVYAQVPYENTAGGFELFSSGVTDLGPELIDFYGAPGVDRSRNTVLFLVGKNFSVHETQVIAGNKCCDFTLLSRDVMKVTIPADVNMVVCRRTAAAATDDPCLDCRPTGKCGPDCYEAVEVHLATPYGVSGRLLIPALPARPSAEEVSASAAAEVVAAHEKVFHPIRFGWTAEEAEGCVCFDAARNLVNFCIHDDAIVIKRSGSTPFGVPKSVQLAGFVEAVLADGTTQRFDAPFGAIDLTFDSRGEVALSRDCAPSSIRSQPDPLVQQVLLVLQSQANLAYHATALNIHGYVRYANCVPDCERPVRMTNTLTIKLGPCRTEKCVLPGTCPTCPPQVDGQSTTLPLPAPAFAKDADMPPAANALERVEAEGATFGPPLPPLAEGLVEEAFTDRGFTDLPTITERIVAPPEQAAPTPQPVATAPAVIVTPGVALPGGIPAIGVVPVAPPADVLLPQTIAVETVTSPPAAPPATPRRHHGLFDIFHHRQR